MKNIDRRKGLEEEPFSYRITKENTVLLYYFGKKVKTLKGKDAGNFFGENQ